MRFSLGLACFFAVSSCFAADNWTGLSVGQKVGVKEVQHVYVITVFKGLDIAPYKVVQVGADYIVLEDALGLNELRIPIYAIKSITTTKVTK